MKNLLLLLFAFSTETLAYVSNPIAFTTRTYSSSKSTCLFAGKGEGEGGAAIAKPKVGVETKTVTKQKQKTVQKNKTRASDPISRRDEKFEDAPMYKVMLIGDDAYDQSHVIEQLCIILEDMDEDQASSIFTQAQAGGKAMCGKYPYEYAELYKEQLLRSDPMIFSDIEEENKDDSGK